MQSSCRLKGILNIKNKNTFNVRDDVLYYGKTVVHVLKLVASLEVYKSCDENGVQTNHTLTNHMV